MKRDDTGESPDMRTDGTPKEGTEPASAYSQWRRGTTQERFTLAVRAWDRHLGRCRSCLSQGQGLCPEGEHLTARAQLLHQNYLRVAGQRPSIRRPPPAREQPFPDPPRRRWGRGRAVPG